MVQQMASSLPPPDPEPEGVAGVYATLIGALRSKVAPMQGTVPCRVASSRREPKAARR